MSHSHNYLRYYDDRFGDIYEIYVDHDGDFITACRSIERIGANPIYYDRLQDIPAAHRGGIEVLLAKKRNG